MLFNSLKFFWLMCQKSHCIIMSVLTYYGHSAIILCKSA
jgi:hypothetical protein